MTNYLQELLYHWLCGLDSFFWA